MASFGQQAGSGSVSITTLGNTLTENFNSLSSTAGTFSSPIPTGWYFNEAGGDNKYRVGTGGSNIGDTYSYGSLSNSDRALGTLRTASLASTIGSQYVNNTGGSITQLQIIYTGEQWRLGTSGTSDNLVFEYSFNATSLTTGTWTANNNLDFNAPVVTGTTGALIGNSPSNKTVINYTITGLNIPAGGKIWLRWTDFDSGVSNQDGLAIDDFNLTAYNNPPTTFAITSGDQTIPSGDGAFQIDVGIANPSSTLSSSVDLVLTGGTGSASDLDFGTSQTLTFPANSTSGQSSVISIVSTTQTGTKTYIFSIQNPQGGNSAQLGSPTQVVITIVYPSTYQKMFYRTAGSGNWSDLSIWETSLDSTTWNPAPASQFPSFNDSSIVVSNSHTITYDNQAPDIDQVTVLTGGVLQIISSGVSLAIHDGLGDDLIIQGTLKHAGPANQPILNGIIYVQSTGTLEVSDNTNNQEIYATSPKVKFDNGSTFLWSANSFFIGGNFFPNSSAGNGPNFRVTGTSGNSGTQNTVINGTLALASTSNFTLSPIRTLSVKGDFINDGSFINNGGTVVFNGTTSQVIQGVSNLIFFNLSVDNTSTNGVVNEATTSIKNAFNLLTSGSKFDFDGAANNRNFTFLSDVSGDAYISSLPLGASFSGKSNVQRYIANPIQKARVYRYLASPVSGASVQDWKNTIPITGIFADPSVSGTYDGVNIVSGSPSLFIYDESVAGVTRFSSENFTPYPTSGLAASNPLVLGKGYSLFVRRATPATSTLTLNVNGNPVYGDQILSFQYTNASNNISNDGYNLLGNPYVAPIDWNSIAANSNFPIGLNNAVYIKDNTGIGVSAGNFVTSAGGVSNPASFNGLIASGQGFYVKANGLTPSGTLTINEGNKSTSATSATFYRTSGSPNDIIRVGMKLKSNPSINDETVIYFNSSSKDGFDGNFDAYKMNNDIINLGSFDADSTNYSINSLPAFSKKSESSKEVNLFYSIKEKGDYELNLFGFDNFNKDVNIFLKDNLLNTITDVRTVNNYQFHSDQLVVRDRFKLMFTKRVLAVEPLISLDQKSIFYPNPTTKDLFIENSTLGDRVKCKVYNANGELIFNETINKKYNSDTKSFYLIDVQNYKAGLYIVSLEDGKLLSTLKFIKE